MVYRMEKDEMIGFGDSLEGITIRCEIGMIWVTVEGDRKDHILAAGERFTVPGSGKAVIMAVKRSTVLLCRYTVPEVSAGLTCCQAQCQAGDVRRKYLTGQFVVGKGHAD